MQKTPSLLSTANLAALSLTTEEQRSLQEDLERIFTFVENLQSLPAENAAPMTAPFEETKLLREDVPYKQANKADILREAPHQDGHFFIVPKFVE